MLLLATLAGWLAIGPTAGATGPSGTQVERYPTELWDAFPLGRKPMATASVVRSAAPRLAWVPPPEQAGSSGRLRILTYMLAAAALLMAGAFLRVLFAGVRRSEASLAFVLALPALRRPRQPRAVMPGYLVAVPSGAGELSLIACHGEPPREGEIIEDADLAPGQFVVVRVGRSPLPRDARPCAFLQTV